MAFQNVEGASGHEVVRDHSRPVFQIGEPTYGTKSSIDDIEAIGDKIVVWQIIDVGADKTCIYVQFLRKRLGQSYSLLRIINSRHLCCPEPRPRHRIHTKVTL